MRSQRERSMLAAKIALKADCLRRTGWWIYDFFFRVGGIGRSFCQARWKRRFPTIESSRVVDFQCSRKLYGLVEAGFFFLR